MPSQPEEWELQWKTYRAIISAFQTQDWDTVKDGLSEGSSLRSYILYHDGFNCFGMRYDNVVKSELASDLEVDLGDWGRSGPEMPPIGARDYTIGTLSETGAFLLVIKEKILVDQCSGVGRFGLTERRKKNKLAAETLRKNSIVRDTVLGMESLAPKDVDRVLESAGKYSGEI